MLISIPPQSICAGCQSPPHQLDGSSLRGLIEADPKGKNGPTERTAVTTVGRGTYSVRSRRYRYVRYFDGTEELYDLESDPHEWHNQASSPAHTEIKQRLAAALPLDEQVAHFVRYGRWKAVLFRDHHRPPLLFEIAPGTGSGGGIGETRSVADQHPEVIEEIRKFLSQHAASSQCLVIPGA